MRRAHLHTLTLVLSIGKIPRVRMLRGQNTHNLSQGVAMILLLIGQLEAVANFSFTLRDD